MLLFLPQTIAMVVIAIAWGWIYAKDGIINEGLRLIGLGDFARSSTLVALILGVTGWAGSAVVLRAQARSLRTREYVAAARVAGESGLRITFVEILPNLVPLIAAQLIFGGMAAVLGEAGLSYLGLGPTNSITLGTI